MCKYKDYIETGTVLKISICFTDSLLKISMIFKCAYLKIEESNVQTIFNCQQPKWNTKKRATRNKKGRIIRKITTVLMVSSIFAGWLHQLKE